MAGGGRHLRDTHRKADAHKTIKFCGLAMVCYSALIQTKSSINRITYLVENIFKHTQV